MSRLHFLTPSYAQTKPQSKPAAKPQTAPVKTMSEHEKQVRAYWSKRLADCSAIFTLCREYGVSPLIAAEFNDRGLSPLDARRELEKMKAIEVWSTALRAAQSMH